MILGDYSGTFFISQKRVRQNEKLNTINRARKSQVKTQIKRFEEVLKTGEIQKASEEFRNLTQKLDKVASTSTMHKKTAARKKSRMAKKLNALKVKKA